MLWESPAELTDFQDLPPLVDCSHAKESLAPASPDTEASKVAAEPIFTGEVESVTESVLGRIRNFW